MNKHALLAILVLALCCLGCGQNNMVQVSGKVKYKDGSPIEGAVRMVRFEPSENSNAEVRKPATGQIQDDGSFKMLTLKPGDGVYKGEYTVAFSILTKPMNGEWLIKEEYRSAEATPFKVKVDRARDDLVFEIEPK